MNPRSGGNRWVRATIFAVLSFVIWGLIGFVSGGWSQVPVLGTVGGLTFCGIGIPWILRKNRKG